MTKHVIMNAETGEFFYSRGDTYSAKWVKDLEKARIFNGVGQAKNCLMHNALASYAIHTAWIVPVEMSVKFENKVDLGE